MELNIEEFERELEINNASVFSLEKELLSHSKKVAKYYRWLAESVKEVDRLTLNLEIITAEILDELAKKEGKYLSSYALDSLRKNKVPLDKRYQKIRKRLSEAKETTAILSGLTRAWESRGYQLKSLVELSESLMLPEPRIYGRGDGNIKFGEKDLEGKLEEAGKKLD